MTTVQLRCEHLQRLCPELSGAVRGTERQSAGTQPDVTLRLPSSRESTRNHLTDDASSTHPLILTTNNFFNLVMYLKRKLPSRDWFDRGNAAEFHPLTWTTRQHQRNISTPHGISYNAEAFGKLVTVIKILTIEDNGTRRIR